MTEVFNVGGMTTEDLNANAVIFSLTPWPWSWAFTV